MWYSSCYVFFVVLHNVQTPNKAVVVIVEWCT